MESTMAWNDPSRKVVSGIFNSDDRVEELLNDLEERGLYQNDISMLMTDKTQERYPELKKSSKMPEGAATGGLTGGLLGALIGGLTMAGSLLIPGAGLLIAGPIIGALTGATVGTAAGSLIGGLVGAGIPEHEAKYYEDALKEEGNILVIAHVQKDDVADVKDLFNKHGAKDLEINAETPDARRDTPAYTSTSGF